MIFVHSSNVAAILCQLPSTGNPKTVGGMYYAKIGMIGVTPLVVQIINIHQSWPCLQQTPLNKHQSATANHRPGRPDMLSQHAKCRQAILVCIAKVIVCKGLQDAKTAE